MTLFKFSASQQKTIFVYFRFIKELYSMAQKPPEQSEMITAWNEEVTGSYFNNI